MVATVLGQVTGQLDRRFLLNAFFPLLVFALVSALAVAAGAGGVTAAVERWNSYASVLQVVLAIGAVSLIFVGANLVANGILWITQVFEGYAAPTTWLA